MSVNARLSGQPPRRGVIALRIGRAPVRESCGIFEIARCILAPFHFPRLLWRVLFNRNQQGRTASEAVRFTLFFIEPLKIDRHERSAPPAPLRGPHALLTAVRAPAGPVA
jgi:hypothetical protein